ncbi:MAG: thiolase family protein [Desulfohalobiaceae bacterium]|nr:thiolase family protein [Desulfohalobiaceae bacterium]
MTKRFACAVGGGQCKWGVREASYLDMAQEAAKACLTDIPGLKHTDIDGLLFSSTFVGRRSTQVNTAPVIAERIGVKPTSICARVDVLCAGGSTGILLAKGLVESNMADIVMVLGGEKLYTPERWQVQYDEMAAVDHDWDGPQGVGPPPLWFSLQAREHMQHYGTTREQMAAVSVANYKYGINNPKGHFQKDLLLEDVLEATEVASPLGLFDCCPLSEGAAAVIVASEERAREMSDLPLVYLRGGAQVSMHSVTANWPGKHLGDWPHLRHAGEKAFQKSKLTPEEINVAQVHDCFSISQIIELEELGFCPKGEGGPFMQDGQTHVTGKIPVNTDGGLLSAGHPFGGTGIRQGVEIVKQLQGRATNQVKDAAFGLTHNLSGANVEHTIVVYGNEPVR